MVEKDKENPPGLIYYGTNWETSDLGIRACILALNLKQHLRL